MLRIDRWKVQQQMKRMGIKTFGELANLVGVAPQTLSAWFGARLGFTSETLETLCNVLNCTPNDILTIDPKAVAPVAELATA
jgi:DNA-binding Xre family transcriptional regulator